MNELGLKKETTTPIVIPKTDTAIITQENDYNIDAFLEKRAEFITKVNRIMVEGKDYHVIQGKKSLAKGGAEKIASIFGWTASFEKDSVVVEAFAKIEGLIAFVCHLEKTGIRIGEGRGAATLAKNSGDPNKTIKMAQKSAFIDAVLRASGLSDFFTQDLEDHPEHLTQPLKTTQTPEAEYYCETHDVPLTVQPAGNSKQGKPYNAFWKCPEKVDGKFCKGPFVNQEGERVKQNPESLEMIADRQMDESSVDMARRILTDKVPKKGPYNYPEGD